MFLPSILLGVGLLTLVALLLERRTQPAPKPKYIECGIYRPRNRQTNM